MRKITAVAVGCATSVALTGCAGSGDEEAPSAASVGETPSSTASALPEAPVAAQIAVGEQPCGVLNVDGTVWVADYRGGAVVRVDDTTVRQIGEPIPTGSLPCGLAHGAGSIWTSDYGGGGATRIDASSGEVLATVPTGGEPFDVTFAFDAAWVTNNLDGTISKIDPETDTATTFDVGGKPAGIVASGGTIWVADVEGRIVGVDPDTGTATTTLDVGGRPAWTAANERDLWVTDVQQGMVMRIDPASGTVAATFDSHPGTRPVDGDVDEAGNAWIPDQNGGLLMKFDREDGLAGTWETGLSGPFVLDVAGDALWTADWKGEDLIRIDINDLPVL